MSFPGIVVSPQNFLPLPPAWSWMLLHLDAVGRLLQRKRRVRLFFPGHTGVPAGCSGKQIIITCPGSSRDQSGPYRSSNYIFSPPNPQCPASKAIIINHTIYWVAMCQATVSCTHTHLISHLALSLDEISTIPFLLWSLYYGARTRQVAQSREAKATPHPFLRAETAGQEQKLSLPRTFFLVAPDRAITQSNLSENGS